MAANRLLECVDGGTYLLRHRGRQRSIVERAGLVLVLQHPLEKIDQDLPVGRVPGGLGNKKPGEAGDGIGIPWCVGDGDTIIGRHAFHARRRFRHAFDGCLRPGSSRALDGGEGHLVLEGKDQFDIADGARRLAHKDVYKRQGIRKPGCAITGRIRVTSDDVASLEQARDEDYQSGGRECRGDELKMAKQLLDLGLLCAAE